MPAAKQVAMVRPSNDDKNEPLLLTSGIFVVQLRSDSDLQRRRLRGRVEHVVSGESEPFASLDALLAFMTRYAATAAAPASTTKEETDREDPDEQK